MVDNPYEPTSHDEGRKRELSPLVSNLLSVMVGIAILGLIVALLLPMRRNARPAYERFQCQNNLQQISLALRLYEADYGSLPPAYTVDANGRPLHSWRTLLLPFLEVETNYDAIDLTKPWDAPANKKVLENCPEVYRCLESKRPASETTYLVVVAPKSMFPGTEVRSIKSVENQTSKVVLVVEVPSEHSVPWMAPRDLTMQSISKICNSDELPHRGTMHCALADGSVTSLFKEELDEEKQALISSIEVEDDASVPLDHAQ